MSTSIDQAFIKQFEREVHESYQRQGSKLRNTVRTIGDVKGSTAIFQKVGKGTASTKSTHGMVPVMNLSHSAVECPLQDYYAGDWVDRLQELKINIDERQVIANAGAYALGRKTDELIITSLATVSGTQEVSDANTGMTLAKVMTAFEKLGGADVPDDGERYAVVGWKQWSELLQIDEFSKSDYIGTDDLPFRGTQAKRWLGTLWMPHSGLPVDGDDIRSCFWYHRTAVGHAAGSDVQTDISWHGDRAAHFVNNMMSQGAALIDDTGIVEIKCDETPD
ncbi:MAG: phage capsid protein [Alphaproteobacteria bacterium]|nr:phage capsid protein [Alphaproteobacteria bacterium]